MIFSITRLFIGVFFIQALFVSPASAQGICGTIVDREGSVTGYTDCQNPFGAGSAFPFTFLIGGSTVDQNSTLQVPLNTEKELTFTPSTSFVPSMVRLYQHERTNYYEMPVTVDELDGGYSAIFTGTGTYTVVIDGVDSIAMSEDATLMTMISSWFISVARAEEVNENRYVRTFTITEPIVFPTCGTITDVYGEVSAIEDCDEPLGPVSNNADLTLLFADTEIVLGGTYPFMGIGDTFTVTGIDPRANSIVKTLYRHEGENYRIVTQFNDPYQFTATGTYTMVIAEEELTPTDTFLDRLRKLLFPTAYAALGDRTHITFDIVDAPEPPPLPSVLFLPGIQASRLYTAGALGTENRLWEPNREADVEAMAMTPEGVSINEVYTRDVVDSAFGVEPIYESFLQSLESMKQEGVISDWKTFPYDWRYDVFDVVSQGTLQGEERVFPIDVLEELATQGPVTIVAHSNGGLLTKALMMQLAEEGKEALVERIVFLASPHLGTPKTVGSLLHGSAQDIGWKTFTLVDEATARDSVRNMPGAYGLLPWEGFSDAYDTPVVKFADTDSTASFRVAYGDSIDSIAELESFLKGNEGRQDALYDDVYAPILANRTFVEESKEHHHLLESWIAPPHVKVVEIVGTGLMTIEGFEYQEFSRKECFAGFVNCQTITYSKPVPRFTPYGDNTVVLASAEGYPGQKQKFYVDLLEVKNTESTKKVQHAEITELPELQELLRNVLEKTNESIRFISDTAPSYNESYDILGVHSPVAISASNNFGQAVSVTDGSDHRELVADIPGTYYVEFAGGKYVLVPSDEVYTMHLEGLDEGNFTLVIEQNKNGLTLPVSVWSRATTTAEMVAEFKKENDEFGPISVDYDGDGIIDQKVTTTGAPIVDVIEYTYRDLYRAISALPLRHSLKQPLLIQAQLAEFLSHKANQWTKFKKLERHILSTLETQLNKLVRQKKISQEQAVSIEGIITFLKNE